MKKTHLNLVLNFFMFIPLFGSHVIMVGVSSRKNSR
jgi:hypothetical protein